MKWTRTRSIGLVIVPLFAFCVAGPTASAEETLRWKFKPDESINYILNRSIDGAVDFNGNQINFSFSMIFDLTWAVKSVAEDGTAELTQTVDRIQFKTKSPIGGELDWDSTQEEPKGSPIWAQMGGTLKAFLGAPVTLKVSPLGVVSDIQFPESLQKTFDEGTGPRRRMNFGGGISASSIKEMIERAFLQLPEQPIATDFKWEQKFSTAFANAGMQVTDVTYAIKEVEEKDGKKVARINATTELTFEPKEDSTEMEVDIAEQEGLAEILFDVTAGRTLSQQSKQKTKLDIVAGEREMSQEINEKVELKQGKSEPAPPKAEKPVEEAKPAEEKKD